MFLNILQLQQYLPLAVLKLWDAFHPVFVCYCCCNSTYRLVYITKELHISLGVCCNSHPPTTTKKLYPRSSKVEFSSINLYNTMLIVSYVCLVYNEHKIVR